VSLTALLPICLLPCCLLRRASFDQWLEREGSPPCCPSFLVARSLVFVRKRRVCNFVIQWVCGCGCNQGSLPFFLL
jgi:hypothetical protein